MRASGWAMLLGFPLVAMMVVAGAVLVIGVRLIVALASAGRSK